MKARINKIITWQGKEYAHIIEDEPFEFCDICSFRDICSKVLTKEVSYENSPMSICNKLSEEADTHFTFFRNIDDAEKYCKNINKSCV